MKSSLLEIIYLLASVTFIIGLKMMGNAKTARNGNLIGAVGMTLAILGTIFLYDGGHQVSTTTFVLIFGAIAIGTVIGWLTAVKVQMTKMPELVSLFNGMGGACAALIGLIEYPHAAETGMGMGGMLCIILGLIIGSVSFSGSIIAFMKLNGTLKKAIRLTAYNMINNVFLLALFAFGAYFLMAASVPVAAIYVLLLMSLLYGVLFTIPIGGADMPVVISLLNSFTGLAAATGGFLYDNQAMQTGGILVGSAGTLLTLAMCKAMNRPLSNVIFGAFGESAKSGSGSGSSIEGSIKDISISDSAILMNYAKKVIIVPGYGLAVAQAQHVIKELENLLEERGVTVKYAIHPVAGRMPGHMNVLLAESNVAYDKLVEMEDINPEFAQTDVVLVVGANDVVNPAAKTDPSSPIFGMPILDVENAQHIIVNKRSMNAGYAGIENELFYNPKTSMLFGDAKDALSKLVTELKTL
ncbi:MAG: NAD(P)(+) transhydrogenase (Re/Si-specific) subunit beta [Bacteroidia bacterium]|nr:NAD(P)(+) transhydrogenase (Re/Si-specific) subunit beta [Bacteroidia bacterium]